MGKDGLTGNSVWNRVDVFECQWNQDPGTHTGSTDYLSTEDSLEFTDSNCIRASRFEADMVPHLQDDNPLLQKDFL